jgi:hypothetical protein
LYLCCECAVWMWRWRTTGRGMPRPYTDMCFSIYTCYY